MSDEFVELASFFYVMDAHILRGLLETDDIEVRLLDEQMSSVLPIYPAMLGGVKVLVSEKDLFKAKKITDIYFENLEDEIKLRCPNCDSTKIRHDYKKYLSSLFINIIGIFTGGYSLSSSSCKYKECEECGFNW